MPHPFHVASSDIRSDFSPGGGQTPHAMPAAPDAGVMQRIHALWDELTTFEAAKSEDALRYLLGAVAGLIDAQNAYWMGAVRVVDEPRDPLSGWRPRVIRYLNPLPNDDTYTRERLRSLNKGQTIDEATVAQARLAGTWRARRLRDLVSPGWFESDTYKGYLGRGVHDSLTVAVPLNANAEGYYGFLRMRPNDPFTEKQRDIAFHAMRGLTWFHRQVVLAEGLIVASSPLSPMEKRVLTLLLTDQTEKVIASNLEVSPSTLHTYVKDILRKFNVSGRNGLLALWLGKQN